MPEQAAKFEPLEDRRLLSAVTSLVKDINTTTGNAGINNGLDDSFIRRSFVEVGDYLYFSADGNLWRTDGTEDSTIALKDFHHSTNGIIFGATNVNGTLYFLADDGIHGRELWKSDGTIAGTTLVKDIRPGAGWSSFGQFYVLEEVANLGGMFYFSADNGTHGSELWKSDGTEAGTVLVKDINPGSGGSQPYNLTNVEGILYFSVLDDANRRELWKSDGSEAGTVRVKDIGPGNSYFLSLTSLGAMIYFSADDGANGQELWKSDGTEAGTFLVKDINAGSAGSNPWGLTNLGGTLYFSANDGTNGSELWKSDGTEAGTILVKDINAGSADSNPWYLSNLGGGALLCCK